jgi:tetratricopeptide (TPR) repeat protein
MPSTEAGMHPLRKQLLTDALKFYQEFLKERESDPQVRFEAARVYGRMANIYESLGEHDKGDEANQQSFAILAQLCQEEPDQPKYQAELAARRAYMGRSLRESGRRVEDVEQHIRGAIRLFEDLVTRLPRTETRRYRVELAFSFAELGYALMYRKDRFAEAEQALLTALEVKRELKREAPDVPDYRLNEAIVSNSLGVFYRTHNRLPQAEQAHRQALEVLAKLASDFPGRESHSEGAGPTCI